MNDSFEQFRLQQKEYHLKQAQLLDSEELQKKIKDYFFWRDQLPILKKEIEEILGKSMDEAATPAASKRGRKKGSTSVSVDQIEQIEQIEQMVIKILADSATLELPAAGIKDKIRANFTENFTDVTDSTLYLKVSNVLKRGEGQKFKKTGELRNTKWSLVQ
jgi:hypothetical protein